MYRRPKNVYISFWWAIMLSKLRTTGLQRQAHLSPPAYKHCVNIQRQRLLATFHSFMLKGFCVFQIFGLLLYCEHYETSNPNRIKFDPNKIISGSSSIWIIFDLDHLRSGSSSIWIIFDLDHLRSGSSSIRLVYKSNLFLALLASWWRFRSNFIFLVHCNRNTVTFRCSMIWYWSCQGMLN